MPFFLLARCWKKGTEKDFIEQLQGIRVEDDEILVSFDVKSLFTSVPIKDAVKVIDEIIKQNKSFEQVRKIAPSTLIEKLLVCLTSTSFQFRRKHYELYNGLAMG